MYRNFLYSLTEQGTCLEMLWEYIKSLKPVLLKNKTEIRFVIRIGVNYLLNDYKYNFNLKKIASRSVN